MQNNRTKDITSQIFTEIKIMRRGFGFIKNQKRYTYSLEMSLTYTAIDIPKELELKLYAGDFQHLSPAHK